MALSDAVGVLPKLDRLRQLEETHGNAIRRLSEEVTALKHRVTRREFREEVLIARAEGAAAKAAFVAGTVTIADLARSLGALEERSRARLALAPRERDSD